MPKLQLLNDVWYLTDTKFAPYEGSSVLYNKIPSYTSFVDELNELCTVNIDGMSKNISFESVEVIVASSRWDTDLLIHSIDIEKAIANLFVFPTIGEKYGANYPDEDDSVIGYYDTKQEARRAIYNWFYEHKINIIRHTEYECEYEINLKNIEITDIKVVM